MGVVRNREQEAWNVLLGLWDFKPRILDLTKGLPAVPAIVVEDYLFGDEMVRDTGYGVAGGAATGAAIGATIDAFLGFMTLGAATALGPANQ